MNWPVVYPELLLLVMACVITLVDLWVTDDRRRLTFWLTQATLAAVAWLHLCAFDEGKTQYAMQNLLVSDAMGHLLAGFAALATLITVAYAQPYLAARQMLKGEYFTLTLFSMLGISVMSSANNFLVIYLGLELMSLSLYALTALRRDHGIATEAAIKYFVLGALASGFLLYGMSMLYGATGSLDLREVFKVIAAGGVNREVLALGTVFMVAGLAFKLGAVPFHILQLGLARQAYRPGGRFSLCLAVVRELRAARHAGQAGLSVLQLAQRLGVDPLQVEPELQQLHSLNWRADAVLGREAAAEALHLVVNDAVRLLFMRLQVGPPAITHWPLHVVVQVAVAQVAEVHQPGIGQGACEQGVGLLHEGGDGGNRQGNVVLDVVAVLRLGQWNALAQMPQAAALGQRLRHHGVGGQPFTVGAQLARNSDTKGSAYEVFANTELYKGVYGYLEVGRADAKTGIEGTGGALGVIVTF
ncbi:hypothetical protein B566_EDAN018343 [Ephemera danica]|nr:hypothetical protein B566_EDAN018343 [Ephemera danica]